LDVRYRRGEHPRSLANLRPVKCGDPPLNPSGRNGSEREREGWEIAMALVRAVQVEPDEERYLQTLRELVRHCLNSGLAGDRRVAIHVLQHLWPLPE
jgi:hypothetical protein